MHTKSFLPAAKRLLQKTGKTADVATTRLIAEQLIHLIDYMGRKIVLSAKLNTNKPKVHGSDLTFLHQRIKKMKGGDTFPSEYYGNSSGRYDAGFGTGTDTASVQFSTNTARAGIETSTQFMGGSAPSHHSILAKSAVHHIISDLHLPSSVFNEFLEIAHHVAHLIEKSIIKTCKGSTLTEKQVQTVFDKVLKAI